MAQNGNHSRASWVLLLVMVLAGAFVRSPALAQRSIASPGQPAQARLTDRRDGQPLLSLAMAGRVAEQSGAGAAYHAFLPIVTAGARTPETPVGDQFHYATFLMPYRLNSALVMSKIPQVAADPQGGIHIAYTSNYPDNSERRPAYYGYCRAACNTQSNFEVVALFDNAWFTQLAVDPSGRPRLLIATWPPESGFDPILHWIYAECNAQCANSASWVTIDLGSGYWYGSEAQNKQTFVLDAQGRPRLIYYAAKYNAMVDPSADMRFMYCDADCSNPQQWGTTILSNAGWYDPALALTPDGLPRIAFNSIGDNQLNFVECDTPTCSEGS
ncbi:MAG TPA: hypothetical protein VFT99_14415, partial [Roseiflexaceae bacterium]|nr:hypothetical protein [Roseiflexaceae bacterium]